MCLIAMLGRNVLRLSSPSLFRYFLHSSSENPPANRDDWIGYVTDDLLRWQGAVRRDEMARLTLDVPAKGAEFDVLIETRVAQHTLEILDALRAEGYPPRAV